MCCLFGFHDYGHKLSRKQRSMLLTHLSAACEDRGTDATGIAYNFGGKQVTYKRPLPAHLMWYRVPTAATAVMGHTRMTTQGSEKHNQNNHPFSGQLENQSFSLAHNGVLFNDKQLQRQFNLPKTSIETDSYVAVQLLEQYGEISFHSLQCMAEQLEGSFTITVLTQRNELYFVKGNNPMCIYHYPEVGIYIYASTEEILKKGLWRANLPLGKPEPVKTFSGEILRIDDYGKITRSQFDDQNLYMMFPRDWGWPSREPAYRPYSLDDRNAEAEYITDLKSVAIFHGLFPEDIDALLADGMDPMEIEELLYCG